MSEPRDIDRLVTDWLHHEAPPRAPGRVLTAALEQAAGVGQERRWVGLGFEPWRGASPRLRWAIVLVALAAALMTAAVGAGALHKTTPKLDLTPPADLQAFVHSTYDRMPDLPPVAIDTLENGSVKGRIYVNRSGAVRIEHYATPDAPQPDTYQILTGTTKAQLATVGTRKVWVEQQGAISEDPRVFVLGAMEGAAGYDGPGCGVAGADPPATGWTYGGLEYIAGRPTFRVTCGGGELWIDVETRLVMRSRGPMLDAALRPVPGSFRTIEVTGLAFGDQPADLFVMAQPSGVARMSSDDYECQLQPAACATPSPTHPPYTPPPGATVGPLPPLPPSPVKNGWIAYSTDGQDPGSTDVTTGSDIYLVREGGEPRLIAGRDGGTTRNVCPAFSPDGTRLAFGEASPLGRAVVVLGVDASGVTGAPVRITVPGPGAAVCVRWSSDGTRVGYLDGGAVVVRGLDGSTPSAAAGDPAVKDLERVSDHSDPLLSPSGDRVARLSFGANDCQLVVAMPDGTAAHVIQPSTCGYAVLAAWSPDGRQVLLLQEVSDADFELRAIGVDSPLNLTVVSTVSTNGARSLPGRGDVSWQPIFP